jgi:hypothetical protein
MPRRLPRPILRVHALASLLTALTGCASTPPPAPSSPEPPTPALAPVPPPTPKPAVSAAPPNGLLGTLRVRNGDVLAYGLREAMGARAPSAKGFAATLLGPKMAGTLDLSRSIDVAAVATGKSTNPEVAFSIALTSLDDAEKPLSEIFTMTPHDGVISLVPKRASTFACEVWQALGAAPYRLVCATSSTALHRTAGYMAQTLAREGCEADAHAEAFPRFFAVILDAVTGRPAQGAGDEFGRRIVADFVHDLGSMTLDAAVAADGIDLRVGIGFEGTTSPLTVALEGLTHNAAAVPGPFWRLPADSLGAFYSHGDAPTDLEPLRALLFDGLAAAMRRTESPEEVDRAMKLLSSLFLTGGPVTAAYGFDPNAALASLDRPGKSDRAALQGWTLFAVEEPATKWADGVRESIAIDKAFASWKPPKDSPEDVKKEWENAPGARTSEERIVGGALPPGSAHFVYRSWERVNGKPVTKEPSSVTHIYIVPEGRAAWIGFGGNEPLLLAKLKGVLAESSSGGLGGRRDLGALHGSANTVGFVTVSLFEALGLPDAPSELARAREALGRLTSPDARAESPVWFVVPRSDEGAGHAVEVRLHLPEKTLGVLIRQAAGP